MKRLWLIAAVWAAIGSQVEAGPSEDWERLIELDAGPQGRNLDPEAARKAAIDHLKRQENAYRFFSSRYPEDPRAFDADLRTVNALAVRADLENSPELFGKAQALLQALEKRPRLSEKQRANIGFHRVALAMRKMDPASSADRESFVDELRRFQRAHASDPRIPRFLVKAAALYDDDARRKRALLEEAQAGATDERTRNEIADDLKRLDLLGTVISLELTTLGGKQLQLDGFRPKVVVLCFFAGWSPPSVEQLVALKETAAALKDEPVQFLGFSLDESKEAAESAVKRAGIDWPVGWDGKSWESPVLRKHGINTLPTVWVLDKSGTLRELSLRVNPEDRIRHWLADPK